MSEGLLARLDGGINSTGIAIGTVFTDQEQQDFFSAAHDGLRVIENDGGYVVRPVPVMGARDAWSSVYPHEISAVMSSVGWSAE